MSPEVIIRSDRLKKAPSRPRSCSSRRFLVASVAFCFLLSAFYFFRASLCQIAASAWIVNDPLQKADAIVILGGGLETRPFEAARLYHLGLAPKILVMKDKPRPIVALGLSPTETELTRQVLLKKDVPESAIIVIGNPETGVANTRDESLALRDWVRRGREDRRKEKEVRSAQTPISNLQTPSSSSLEKEESRKQKGAGSREQGARSKELEISASQHVSVSAFPNGPRSARSMEQGAWSLPVGELSPPAHGSALHAPRSTPLSVIIVTDLFHSRRVRWLFCKELKPTGAKVSVDATPVREYSRADWWQHEQGIVAFQNEVLKLIYYYIKY